MLHLFTTISTMLTKHDNMLLSEAQLRSDETTNGNK